jgi:uncharacterized protein (DUF1810 family)
MLKSNRSEDPYDLRRFLLAQERTYDQALAELRRGKKESHWMWFVFPQFKGLGASPRSKQYAIGSVEEASAYLHHEVLGHRLVECAEAVVGLPPTSIADVFGEPDDMKLRSSATLFALVASQGSVFDRLLDRYFASERDAETLRLVRLPDGIDAKTHHTE